MGVRGLGGALLLLDHASAHERAGDRQVSDGGVLSD